MPGSRSAPMEGPEGTGPAPEGPGAAPGEAAQERPDPLTVRPRGRYFAHQRWALMRIDESQEWCVLECSTYFILCLILS